MRFVLARAGNHKYFLLLLAASAGLQAVLVATATGDLYDLQNIQFVNGALHGGNLSHIYASFGVDGPGSRWPYPPGYFPVILAAGKISALTHASFFTVMRMVCVAANLLLALLIYVAFVLRGATPSRTLAATALVAFGPAFLAIPLAGQLDSAAFVPAVAAFVLWEARPEDARRGLWCGLLIGLAASIKTVPGVLVLALIPHVRGRRELVMLVGATIAVPLIATAPFLLGDWNATTEALRYHGVPGVGGISLIVQPSLAKVWIAGHFVGLDHATNSLQDLATPISLVAVAATGAFAFRYRVRPATAASLLILALWVFGVNFFFNYAVWGLPFFLLANELRATALVQAALFVPMIFRFGPTIGTNSAPSVNTVQYVYVPLMIAIWLAWGAWLAWSVSRASQGTARPLGSSASLSPA